jgi:hypothetical protein
MLPHRRTLPQPLFERQSAVIHQGEKLNVRFLASKVTVAGLVGVAQFFRGLSSKLS